MYQIKLKLLLLLMMIKYHHNFQSIPCSIISKVINLDVNQIICNLQNK